MELPNSVYRHLIQTGYSKKDMLFMLRQHNFFIVTSVFIEACGYTIRMGYSSSEFYNILRVLTSKMIKVQSHSLNVIESYFYSEKLQSSQVINGDLTIAFSSRPAYEVMRCLFSVVSRSFDNTVIFSGMMTFLSHFLSYLRKSNLSIDVQLTLITHSSVPDTYMIVDDGDVIQAYQFNDITGNMIVASTTEALSRANSWNVSTYPLQLPNFMIVQLLNLITSGAMTYDNKRYLWESLVSGSIKQDMIDVLVQYYSKHSPIVSCLNAHHLSLWNEFPAYSETLRMMDLRDTGKVLHEEFTLSSLTLSQCDVRSLYREYLRTRGLLINVDNISISLREIGVKIIECKRQSDDDAGEEQYYSEDPETSNTGR